MADPRFDVLSLFPIPLYVGLVDEAIVRQARDAVRGLEYEPNVGNTNTLNHYVFDEPALAPLRAEVLAHMKIFQERVLASRNELYITQSWANITRQGESHHPHYHFNSVASGVVYLTAGGDLPPIVFKSDRKTQIMPQLSENNVFNMDTFSFKPKGPMLVMFPSFIDHHVPSNPSGEERISIAFNTFLRGDLGSEGQLSRLKL